MFVEERKTSLLEYAANEAKEFLLDKFNKGSIIAYNDIKYFLIQKTILKEGQFLKYVIRPLINKNKIKKMGDVSNKDFKGDRYKIL